MAAVRAAPFKHALTFAGVHVTIAQLALLPAYAVLRYTGLGTSLVAGPQAAYFLARPLPDWACSSLGIKEGTTDAGTKRAPTVEDAVEMGLKRVASGAWAGGGAIFRLVGAVKKGKDDPVAMLQQVTDEYKRGKQQGLEQADAAIDEVKEKKSLKQSIGGALGGRAQKIAGDVKIGQVRDALGAYVIVKVSAACMQQAVGRADLSLQMLLPLRIPLSLWLTPRFARGMSRVFTRRG
ncbi:hypothetical protein FA09DRAFT_329218 [Tilletiopsis washingtonensis]|uniref:Uncharacterized protein n=1 Tax=Tilletiopsis washingtonensis TaxID=58919 RepID=A0A316ZAJ0_9BASI|nr:hypothetical protein FA09DRAFT_329218 [Tilletiopsis washingtonensis]PWN98710.1 hypothetical protein FA09DRAFT_329218 [Tilletiopsis washingtonensis]